MLRPLWARRARLRNRRRQNPVVTTCDLLEPRLLLAATSAETLSDEIAPGAVIERTTIDAADAPIVPVQIGASELNGNGLEFNLIPAVGMSQQAIDGFQEAADLWSAILADDILVNINIDFTTLGPGILGSASSTTEAMTLTAYRTNLLADATSADDATATANLPAGSTFSMYTSDPSTGSPFIDNNGTGNNTFLNMNTTVSKAIGVRAAGDAAVDASITFSDAFTWDFDRSDGIAAGAFDFVGVAAHEIGHALGFRSGADTVDVTSGAGPSAPTNLDNFRVATGLDMFRFSADSLSNGTDIDLRADTAVKFFSIDGGATQLTTFSTGRFNGDGRQASHWKDNLGIGIMDPTAAPGELVAITEFDTMAMDVMGWDRADLNSTGSIAGTKFNDLNGNGIRDVGEPGLEGWTIFIDENGNGVFEDITGGLEPDDYPPGTDLRNVNPDVTISEVTAAGVPTNAFIDAFQGAFSSTGTLTFRGSNPVWGQNIDAVLRLDFNIAVTSVSIDAISDDSSDFGLLEIYDAGDNLLGSYVTSDLGTGVVETMTLSSDTPIAYALATGQGGQYIYLDNIVYSQQEQSTTTDSNGDYSFSNLPNGSYQLGEVSQLGWESTVPKFGRLFATAIDTQEIIEIDPATGAEINRFAHPGVAAGGADGLAFNGTSLFFTDRTTLFELNPNDGSVIDSDTLAAVGAGADIDGLAFLDGQLVAMDFNTNQILFIDPATDLVTSTVSLDPGIDAVGGMTGAASRGTLFVTDLPGSLIFEVDPATGAIINAFGISVGAFGLAFVDGSLFVGDDAGNLTELDPDTGAPIGFGSVAFPGDRFSALAGDGGIDGFWSVYVGGQDVTGIDFGNRALSSPSLVTSINGGSVNRSGIATVEMTFSEAMTIGDVTDLRLYNHTTSTFVDMSSATLSDNGTSTITLNLMDGVAPDVTMDDGAYTLEIPATAAINGSAMPLDQTYTISFHKLTGDVNGSGIVSFDDYAEVQANFAASVGAFGDGDANGSGLVSFDDYAAVQSNFAASVSSLALDFGDADGAGYATLLADGAARHVINGNSLLLGVGRDGETDGQPTAGADGDDTTGAADEDGVSIDGGALETEDAVNVTVTVTGGSGFLNVWIDYNQDGDWDDAGEHVVDDLAVGAGAEVVPVTAPLGSQGTAIARFRLTSTAGYSYSGLAADGEVEDYAITITNNTGPAAITEDPVDAFLPESLSATNESAVLNARAEQARRLARSDGRSAELIPPGQPSLPWRDISTTFASLFAYPVFGRHTGTSTALGLLDDALKMRRLSIRRS